MNSQVSAIQAQGLALLRQLATDLPPSTDGIPVAAVAPHFVWQGTIVPVVPNTESNGLTLETGGVDAMRSVRIYVAAGDLPPDFILRQKTTKQEITYQSAKWTVDSYDPHVGAMVRLYCTKAGKGA